MNLGITEKPRMPEGQYTLPCT